MKKFGLKPFSTFQARNIRLKNIVSSVQFDSELNSKYYCFIDFCPATLQI